MYKISSIDLFAGVGGMRLSLNRAIKKMGLEDNCKLYSEINLYCQQTYAANFPDTPLIKDIKSVKNDEIKKKNPKKPTLKSIIAFYKRRGFKRPIVYA